MDGSQIREYVSSYRENGFLVIDQLFDADTVATAHAAIDEILSTPDLASVAEFEPNDKTVVRRIWSPTKRHPLFEAMAADPRLLDVIEQLIGPNIFFHYSKLHMKGPRVGSVVEWHQDFSYYPHTNTDLATALIYLDDANKENACLWAVPGSHRRGLRNHYVDGFFRGKVALANDAAEVAPVAIEAPAGSVVFIHCLLLHHSAANRSEKVRRAFLPAYRAADAFPIYFGPHASHNEPGIKLLRGVRSSHARVEPGNWLLPISEREFGSLFDIQEGSHLRKGATVAGYAERR
jgi:ectoine hydroxylase-related dioxygenase (phytanoyl-CoA dioxygenase family)